MIENKGDLISREALKENEPHYDEEGYRIFYESEIDKAPTVEANNIIDGLNNEIDDLSENLAWYINERNRLLKKRRPQGEWINMLYHPFGHYAARCNKCNVMITTSHISFCPNCGADMRGKEE